VPPLSSRFDEQHTIICVRYRAKSRHHFHLIALSRVAAFILPLPNRAVICVLPHRTAPNICVYPRHFSPRRIGKISSPPPHHAIIYGSPHKTACLASLNHDVIFLSLRQVAPPSFAESRQVAHFHLTALSRTIVCDSHYKTLSSSFMSRHLEPRRHLSPTSPKPHYHLCLASLKITESLSSISHKVASDTFVSPHQTAPVLVSRLGRLHHFFRSSHRVAQPPLSHCTKIASLLSFYFVERVIISSRRTEPCPRLCSASPNRDVTLSLPCTNTRRHFFAHSHQVASPPFYRRTSRVATFGCDAKTASLLSSRITKVAHHSSLDFRAAALVSHHPRHKRHSRLP
jgi:hypothetical protein